MRSADRSFRYSLNGLSHTFGGMTELSIEAATAMVGRAREHAESLGVAMTLAVIDSAGHRVAFARLA